MTHPTLSRGQLLGETGIIYLLIAAVGVSTTIIGTVLTLLISEFGIPIADGGVFPSAQNIGCLLGILLSGVLLDRFDKRALVLLAFLLFTLSNFVIARTGALTAFIVVVFLAGAVFKFIDASLNTCIADMHVERKSVFMNLLHCSYGIGSFLGPVLTGYLLKHDYPWRTAYSVLAWACLVLSVVFFLVVRNRIGRSAHAAAQAPAGLRTLFNMNMLILWCVLVFYCGHQIGVNSWLPAYQTMVLGVDPASAGVGVSVFWFGLILSRLVCSALLRYFGVRTLLILGSAFGGLSLIAGVLSGHNLVAVIGSGGAGFFAGSIIPMSLTVGYYLHPEAKGKVSMLLFLGITTGGIVFPWIMGLLASFAGLTSAIVLDGALLLGASLLAMRLPRKIQ